MSGLLLDRAFELLSRAKCSDDVTVARKYYMEAIEMLLEVAETLPKTDRRRVFLREQINGLLEKVQGIDQHLHSGRMPSAPPGSSSVPAGAGAGGGSDHRLPSASLSTSALVPPGGPPGALRPRTHSSSRLDLPSVPAAAVGASSVPSGFTVPETPPPRYTPPEFPLASPAAAPPSSSSSSAAAAAAASPTTPTPATPTPAPPEPLPDAPLPPATSGPIDYSRCNTCLRPFQEYLLGLIPSKTNMYFPCVCCCRRFCSKHISSRKSRLWRVPVEVLHTPTRTSSVLPPDKRYKSLQGYCCETCFDRIRTFEERLQRKTVQALDAERTRSQQEQSARQELAHHLASHQQRLSSQTQELSHYRQLTAQQQEQREQLTANIQRLMEHNYAELEARIALGKYNNDFEAALAALNDSRQQRHHGSARRASADFAIVTRDIADFAHLEYVDSHRLLCHARDTQNDTHVLVHQVQLTADSVASEMLTHRLSAYRKLYSVYEKMAIPNICSVQAMCSAPGKNYLIMPFVESAETLVQWLGKPRLDWQLQSVFNDVLLAIEHLKTEGIVGVLRDCDDVLVARDSVEGKGLSALLVPSFPEQAVRRAILPPEVAEIGEPGWTSDSDAYVLGCLMYMASFKSRDPPVLMPDSDRVRVPPECTNDRLRDLLENGLLLRDPNMRLSVSDARCHVYFTTSPVVDYVESGQIIKTDLKLASLEELIKQMKVSAGSSKVRISVNRHLLVESVCSQLMAQTPEKLLHPFNVTFDGEAGVDCGGLTIELYNQFFSAIFADEGLFSTSGSTGNRQALYLPAPLDAELPNELMSYRLRLFEAVGRLLAKAIFERIPVPVLFSPSLYKFVLDQDVSLVDLEAFDPMLAASLREMLAMDDVSVLFLDFSDIPGVRDPDRIVNNDNRREYVTARIRHVLIDSRLPALKALKKGISALGMDSHLKLFTCSELMSLVQGQQTVTAEQLLAKIRFEGFPRSSQTPEFFRQTLEGLASKELQRLLCFITASTALPSAGIVVKQVDGDGFPVAHTCFGRLDLPDYNNPQQVQQRLQFVIDHLEDAGFGLA